MRQGPKPLGLQLPRAGLTRRPGSAKFVDRSPFRPSFFLPFLLTPAASHPPTHPLGRHGLAGGTYAQYGARYGRALFYGVPLRTPYAGPLAERIDYFCALSATRLPCSCGGGRRDADTTPCYTQLVSGGRRASSCRLRRGK